MPSYGNWPLVNIICHAAAFGELQFEQILLLEKICFHCAALISGETATELKPQLKGQRTVRTDFCPSVGNSLFKAQFPLTWTLSACLSVGLFWNRLQLVRAGEEERKRELHDWYVGCSGSITCM